MKKQIPNHQSKKALHEIPKELNKLNQLIAIIGEALLNREIKEIKKNKDELMETVKNKNEKARK